MLRARCARHDAKARGATSFYNRPVEIAILGPLEVGGHALGSPKERAIVELLALRAPRGVAMSELVGALWGPAPPASALRTVQSLVSRLRRAIPELVITRDGNMYRASIAPDEVDAHRFEQLINDGTCAAKAGDQRAAIHAFTAACALWRSTPITDLADGSAAPEIARLEEQHRCLVEELAEARLAAGEHRALIAELKIAVADEPLRERRWGQLMVALARDGRRADALRTFQQLRRMLAEELGLAPSVELVALDRAIATDERETQLPPTREVSEPLPVWLTSFIGRADDERTVAKRLHEHRLVTITGPGGVGKTRIACVVADGLANRFSDGVRFVALDSVSDPSRVASTFAAALGVREEPGAGVVDVLITGCAYLDALFVVDNCEHVISEVATLLQQMLHKSRRLHVLTTSREALGVSGEAVVPLQSLAVPEDGIDEVPQLAVIDSVRLFVDRASAVDTAFALDDACAPIVASLCRRLDGLPLAIELAAAHSDVLSAADLDARVAAQPGGLRSRDREVAERHRTLDAVLDWSVDLLDEPHRAVLERMSVFRGSASLEAIEAVVSDPPVERGQVFETLAGLVRRSLVVAESAGTHRRYRLLETVRAHALRLLEQRGDLDRRRDRHLAWVDDWSRHAAVGLAGPAQAEWLDRVALDHDNLDAALAWGTIDSARAERALEIVRGLFNYWMARGMRRTEGVRWLSAAVAAADTAEPAARADALAQGALIVMWNDLASAAELAERAREVSDRAPRDQVARGHADLAAAVVAWFRGDASLRGLASSARDRLSDFPRAIADLLVVTSLDGEARHRAAVANALWFRDLGDEHIYGGNLGGSVDFGVAAGVEESVLRAHSQEALAIARAFACPSCEALVLGGVGLLEQRLDQRQALETAQRAVMLSDGIDETGGVVVALDLVIGIMGSVGRVHDAVKLAGAADALRARTGYHLAFPGRRACRNAGLAHAPMQLSPTRHAELRTEGEALSYEATVQLAFS